MLNPCTAYTRVGDAFACAFKIWINLAYAWTMSALKTTEYIVLSQLHAITAFNFTEALSL